MEKVKDKLYGFAAEYSISRAEFDKIAPDHPNKKLNGIEECFDMLVAISEITGHDNMAGMIRKMDYKKFLDSKYWELVSKYTKLKMGNKCAVCESGENIHVHHKNYMSHGYEHIFWYRDLVLLCGSCHSKYHSEHKKHNTITWQSVGNMGWGT